MTKIEKQKSKGDALTGLLIKHYVHFNLEVGGRDKGVYQNHIIKCTLKGRLQAYVQARAKALK